jgi:hypothetical protein
MTGAPLIPEIADSVLDWCEAPKRRLRALSGPHWFPADICCDARMCAQKLAGERTGAGHFANGSKGGVVFALKLRFDSGLIYDRPYFLDPFVSKLIEYVFGKRDSLPVYIEAKQDSFRRAVEAQTAR